MREQGGREGGHDQAADAPREQAVGTHGTPGKRTLVETQWAPALQPAAPAQPGGSALHRAIELARLGLAHLGAIEASLVPAYRGAVTAMDTAAVKALAAQIVGGVAHIVDAQAHVGALVPESDPHAPQASTAETDPFSRSALDLAMLSMFKTPLDVAVSATLPRLAVELSPQMFGGQPVAGAAEAPPRGADLVGFLAYEASLVIELLEEADAIQALVKPVDAAQQTSEPATDVGRRRAVERLERWKGRPINFMFLARVLAGRGVWAQLQGVEDLGGHTADQLSAKVGAQAKETGTTADLGTWWDAGEARDALTYGATDWAVTDSNAMDVFNMLAKAEPRARGLLVHQLQRMGLLDRLCKNLPWGLVKELWETIDDPVAARFLEPYWEGKGHGESLGALLLGQHHWYTDALDTALDYGTLGAKRQIDASWDARERGEISDDRLGWSAASATARAGFVGAAMMATGSLAGELAGGVADGLGAGEVGAGFASAGFGGGAGAVGGHLVGDAYDQVLNGKQGFDSLSSYGKDFGLGGITGMLLAPVGLAASRFLPQAGRTMAQEYAARYPRLTRVLEAARRVGTAGGTRVRMSVREFLDSFGDGGPPGFRLAYAGGGALATAPPDASVVVTVRPLRDLNAPMARLRDGGGQDEDDDLIEVEQVELEPGSVFDPYEREASHLGESEDGGEVRDHADELPADYQDLGDHEGGMSVRDARNSGVVAEEGAEPMDRHHVFPQSWRKWFADRGVDVDQYCVDLTDFDHDILHGGNQGLAQKHWREAEWRSRVMDDLTEAEALQAKLRGDPSYKLTPDEILEVGRELMAKFDIADRPFVHFTRTPRS